MFFFTVSCEEQRMPAEAVFYYEALTEWQKSVLVTPAW